MIIGKPVLVNCCEVLFSDRGCSFLFISGFVTSVDLSTVQLTNDHVNCIHVSSAQNPMYRLKVNEFAVLSTSEFCLRGF